MNDRQPATILFQPPNRIGLGHISRLIAIALEVRRAAPGARTPFVIEGGGHGLIDGCGFPEINLPTAHDLYETSKWTGWDRSDRQGLMLELATTVVSSLMPDLVVFDCFPNVAVAMVALEQQIPIAICLRKTGQPQQFFDRFREFGPAVRLVLIPHGEGEFEVPADFQSRVRFTGTIGRPVTVVGDVADQRSQARRVVISAGGGGWPGTVDFYNLAIEAFTRVRARVPDLEGLLVAGPLFTEWPALQPADGIRVVPFDPSLSSTFAAADAVVCQAGYNTIAEIETLAVPAIIVPADRDFDDQFERARVTARGSASCKVYEGTDPAALAALLGEACAQPRHPRRSVPATPGAACAADSLLALVS